MLGHTTRTNPYISILYRINRVLRMLVPLDSRKMQNGYNKSIYLKSI